MLATVLAILLVYMVMAAQFKSLIDPFIIMFAVPLGLPGVILILSRCLTPPPMPGAAATRFVVSSLT